ADAVEQIDIGGPAMIRATAKNFAHTTVLTNPNQYEAYLSALKEQGEISLGLRQRFAGEAFALTNAYDQAIAAYFSQLENTANQRFGLSGTLRQSLRYGENPHQSAAWYQTGREATGWASAEKLQGKELSYNNLVDLEAARRIINEFPPSEPAVAILKHTNPCGVALAPTLAEAYQKAFAADATSAFGGIVALNQPIDSDTATAMTQTFLECIVAPGCDLQAQEILAKKKNLRVLLLPDFLTGPAQTIKAIAGGFFVQAPDVQREDHDTWQVVTEKQPSPEQLAELAFAWKVCKHVKSNAITITKDKTTLGVGAGQMNRVGSVEIAIQQAGEKAEGACLASDAFFPFDDSVRTAAAAGITTIIQPGGSLRDQDSIQAANELGLVMIFTGTRHFLH
ncbi:MAG: bifunctional phosphoribosylaminoimidazolecarboxamide formyltransferase/IMP cyclohydrolase, partial [Synechocystis sp.]